MDFTGLCTDEKMEREGVWTDLGLRTDSEFLLGSIYSARFQLTQSAMLREERLVANAAKTLTADDIEQRQVDFECRLYACIVRGWKNVELDGKPFEYSPENAYELLRRSAPLRFIIKEHAKMLAPYRLRDDEGGLGNSSGSSTGNSSEDQTGDNGSGDSPIPPAP